MRQTRLCLSHLDEASRNIVSRGLQCDSNSDRSWVVPRLIGSPEGHSRWAVAEELFSFYGEEKPNLHAEHGVDPGSRSLGGGLSTFKRGNGSLLGGWRRSHRLLHAGLIRGGRRSRSTGRCNARGSSGWLGSKLSEIGEIPRLFGARLNCGK